MILIIFKRRFGKCNSFFDFCAPMGAAGSPMCSLASLGVDEIR